MTLSTQQMEELVRTIARRVLEALNGGTGTAAAAGDAPSVRRDVVRRFRVPPLIYFEPGSLSVLRRLEATRAFIVTDPTMVKIGHVDKVAGHLAAAGIRCETFADVEPDPSVETVNRGVTAMRLFSPDAVIAVGGGSAIDAAKVMRYFYEHPQVSFDTLLTAPGGSDRVTGARSPGSRTLFVAIPTTSGTGSEVTTYAVVTDKVRNTKYPLADSDLAPDIAIVDSELVCSVPKAVAADTGLDVLTHALEAYVSLNASECSDAMAAKAIELVFKYLPAACTGGETRARDKMHHASTIAGMAFTNAGLGITHSMAHILGGKFRIPHGRANAILLPHVIAFNALQPPEAADCLRGPYRAGKRYAEIARHLGLPAQTQAEGVAGLIQGVRSLMQRTGVPATVRECGVEWAAYREAIPEMARIALADRCTASNPRVPVLADLERLFLDAYGLEVPLNA